MRYFDIHDICDAIFSSSLLGIFAGGLYSSLSTLISCILGLFGVLVRALRSNSIRCAKNAVRSRTAISSIRRNVYDFIFFVIVGILYVFLSYLTLDGIHRLYVLLALIFAFFISKRTLGVVFENIILSVYKVVYSILFCLTYVITYPLHLIYRLLFNLLKRPFAYAVTLFRSCAFKLRIARKQRQIRRYFKSTPLI